MSHHLTTHKPPVILLFMRKNLTISLDPTDWALVRAWAKATRDTYSGLFHSLIQKALGGQEVDPKITAKYRQLFQGHADYLSRRAAAFSKARRLANRPA